MVAIPTTVHRYVGWVPTASRTAARIAVLAAAYYGAAKLGISLEVAEGVVTPVWAPTGLALGALLLFGYEMWPGVALGALLANATSDVAVGTAAGIAAGNTLEAVAGAWLIKRIPGFRVSFARARDVLAVVIFGGFVSTAIAATVGTTTLLLADEISRSGYRSTWFLWWFGDAIGAVIVAPVLLAWASLRRWRPRGDLIEGTTLLAALIGGSLLVFMAERWQYPFLLFPLLLWAALRFGVLGAATANFIVSGIAVWETVRGSLLIGDASPTETVQILQALIAFVAVSMLVAAASIGERAEAEGALEHSLSVLQATLDSTADGVLVVDLDGGIVNFNQQFVDMWRLPPDVVAERDDEEAQRYVLDQLVDPEAFLARVRVLYAQREDESTDVLMFKDGRVFERYSRPQRVDGVTVGRVWSFRDVTESRQTALVKGRFLDMATHEMRNPLGVVSALAAVMLEDWSTVNDDDKREYVRRIHNQADRLARLVEDLLLTSRVEGGKLDLRVRPIEVVDATRRLLRELERDDVEVRAPSPVVAVADPDYFQHMLGNYLGNADKYGQPPVWVEVVARDGFAQVLVGDHGAGVPAELASRLFERFSPAREVLNPAAPGSGLGLWIVRELARAQGGDAFYDGSRFCFTVPLAENA